MNALIIRLFPQFGTGMTLFVSSAIAVTKFQGEHPKWGAWVGKFATFDQNRRIFRKW